MPSRRFLPIITALIRWLYNLCFPVVFLLLLPLYLRRMVRRGNFREHFWQRLGIYSPELRDRLAASPGRPWLQAVSVGEMLTALKLIAALRERQPDLPLILSTTTTTGFRLAKERVPDDVEVIYTPVDLWPAVRNAYRVLRPGQVVIVDGGLWPNLLWEAKKRNLPTALVNARLSPRSERRFRRFRRLAAAMFRLLDCVCVPEPGDVERWQSLGVPPANLHRTGSVKFDDSVYQNAAAATASTASPDSAKLRDLLCEIGVAAAAPILLAGSTHPGEEKILAQVFLEVRRRFQKLFLIVVPRHVERSPEVRADLETLGLKVLNRTAIPAGGEAFDALLVDTTGELREWYAVATLVFIGKSLTAIGGQNPAEPITVGKPVLFGPHMENFADLVSALLSAQGAVQIADTDDLAAQCVRLLDDPKAAGRMAEAAQRQLAAHRGAAGRTAEWLLAQPKFPLASGADRFHIPAPAARGGNDL